MKCSAFRAGILVFVLCLSFTGNVASRLPRRAKERTSPTESAPQNANRTRALFYHAYNSYMQNAWPEDELRPLSCRGQGSQPFNTGTRDSSLDDICGDYSLTRVDALDSLVIMNDYEGFESAVKDIIQVVSFDKDVKIQVFEATIRIMGGLLSGHIFASEKKYGFSLPWYDGELLALAVDLGNRLLPAFKLSPTGIPYARINLRYGVSKSERIDTCTAGATSLILEFATLSRLSGNKIYEDVAVKALYAVWNQRSNIGLVGNAIDLTTGAWLGPLTSGIGAGIDSFFEYTLKAYILLGEDSYHNVFRDSYLPIMNYSRSKDGFFYRGVDISSGLTSSIIIDSLSAFWPGLQVLAGDVESAVKSHLIYWNLWQRYSGLPERFDIYHKEATSLQYPLRPEFIESNYFLYRATGDDFYLRVAERILYDLETRSRVKCGMAAISNVITGEVYDRQESFAISETLKYLYLTFELKHWLHEDDSNMVFTTEGHLLILNSTHLKPPSRASRNMRKGENLFCPMIQHTIVGRLSSEFSSNSAPSPDDSGLRGGIHDRHDYQSAREAVDLHVEYVSMQEQHLWSESQYCSIKKNDVEVLLSVKFYGQGTGIKEIVTPGLNAVYQLNTGWVIKNLTGLQITLALRLDGQGYEIIQIGHHRIHTGQNVLIVDPSQLDKWNEVPENVARTGSSPYVVIDVSILGKSDVHKPFRFVAATAAFGPDPSVTEDKYDISLTESFSLNSGSFPLHQRIENSKACQQFNHTSPNMKISSPTQSIHGVLLTHRGECTFHEKALFAQQAGYLGVLVASDEEILFRPSGHLEFGTTEYPDPSIPLMLISASAAEQISTVMMLAEKNSYQVMINIIEDKDLIKSYESKIKTSYKKNSQSKKPESEKTSSDNVTYLVVGNIPVINAVLGR